MRFDEQAPQFMVFDIKFIGAPDLPMQWSMQREWYERHCPLVTYKELAREDHNAIPTRVDRLWNEPECGTRIFDRILNIRAHVVYPAPEDVHTKRGVEENRNTTFYFGVNMLEEADIWPFIGDHIVFDRQEYIIQAPTLDPDNRWGHSNMPLHVTCATERYRYGDGRIPNTLLDKAI